VDESRREKSLAPTGVRTPNIVALNESLHRLCCLGQNTYKGKGKGKGKGKVHPRTGHEGPEGE